MTYLIIIVAILFVVISEIIDEGSFFSKLSLSALVASIAFSLLRWITGWTIMTLLAKISITVVILSALIAIIARMAEQ